MASDRKQTRKQVHLDILRRAKKLSESGSKVFDKDHLKANEKYLLKESKLLGLSNDDIQEIQTASEVSTKEIEEKTNLLDEINAIASTIGDYVEQQKRLIPLIESYQKDQMKELMALINIDKVELDLVTREKVTDIESYHNRILYYIANSLATQSILTKRMLSVNSKLQVSKTQHP